jgi:hypothetical protein
MGENDGVAFGFEPQDIRLEIDSAGGGFKQGGHAPTLTRFSVLF